MKDLISVVYEHYFSKVKATNSIERKKELSDKATLEINKEVWKEIQQMTFQDFCEKQPTVAFVKDKKAYEVSIML